MTKTMKCVYWALKDLITENQISNYKNYLEVWWNDNLI